MRTMLRVLDRIGDTGAGLTAIMVALVVVPTSVGAALLRAYSADPAAPVVAAMFERFGWLMGAWTVGLGGLYWAAERLTPRLGVEAGRLVYAAHLALFGAGLVAVFAAPDLWAWRMGVCLLAFVVCFPNSWAGRLEARWDAAMARLDQAATAALAAIRGP